MNPGDVSGVAARLLDSIGQVTADEFYRHDTHYNQDSRLGRELLYLIANDDWIRSTTEVINLNRGDAVDSVVKVNVDTSKITHEAFEDGTGPLWLPLLVLTLPDSVGASQAASPGQLTVINENGALLSPMREADVWHALSAALAEIFMTIADTRWPWPAERRPGADRGQRVLLSAALFRTLSDVRRADEHDTSGRARQEESDSPLGEAKRKLRILLRRYFKAYERPAKAGAALAADTEAQLLTNRAAELLFALTRAVVVVVGVGRSDAPAVLTLTAPTRKLHHDRWPVYQALRHLQPRARLEIDLLLPSGDADRQVEIGMPDGVSIDTSARRSPTATPGLDADVVVTVDPPPAAARLATLMHSVLTEPVQAVRDCLAGLALTQADTLGEVLNHHLVLAARPSGDAVARPTEPYEELNRRTARTSGHLHRLRELLREVAVSGPDPDPDLKKLRETWGDGGWLRHVLLRRASVSVPGPDTLTGRTGLIENSRQRVPPGSAKVTVPVEVADARFYSIARFSGAVSIVLMAVVLLFYLFELTRRFRGGAPSPEVLTTVLTLFSVIQAGRVEAPDRSTLRGRLTGAGNWLIIASTLPTVVLAIAIAFGISGWAPVSWSIAAITVQALLLLAMWRGPLSASGNQNQPLRVLRTSPTPDYGKTGLLRAVWWQTATANALLLGRQAHGFLVWEHRPEPGAAGPMSVRPVLGMLQPGVPAPNILAMLRSGTTREAITFVVLREPPAGLPGRDAVTIPLRIDPDRLTPSESPAEYVDVLVGVPGADCFLPLADHPVAAVLRAAKDTWLQVSETQLPVAPPALAAPPGTLWARVRIGFRTPEYGRIADFLREIAAIPYPVWVRSWPERVPRPLGATGVPAAHGTRQELMTARDFDVVSVARTNGEDPRARTWRMLAVCVHTSFGVEQDVLGALAREAPGLRLAAISHAELHGMDLFVILGHVPSASSGGGALSSGGGSGGGSGFERALAARAQAPALRVVLDEWRTAEELGFAEAGPLLRVDVRTRDRSGTLQVVLDSLHRALRRQLPSLPEEDTSDWRVLLQTGAGHSALARITLGLPVPAEEIRDWPPSRWAEVARDASAGAADPGPDFRIPEDMVLTVHPVKHELPLPPPSRRPLSSRTDSP